MTWFHLGTLGMTPSRLRPAPDGTKFRRAMLLVLALVAGCERAGAPAPTATPTNVAAKPDARALDAWRMRATVAPGAESIAVQMCFEGAPPRAVKVGTPDAEEHIEDVHIVGRDVVLAGEHGRWDTSALAPGECVAYRVDFRRMAERAGRQTVSRVGDSVSVRQGLWLLWPVGASPDARATIELELPAGMRASVPWPRKDGERSAYMVDETASRWRGYTAFGELTIDTVEAFGSTIEIARLDAPMKCSDAGVRAWILDAVESVAMLYGEYPRDRLQVVVIPVNGESVYFGMAARGGGSGVMLLVGDAARDGELPGGWTTVHELLHHGMPFVQEAWMAEGFVSYYTELMRTRMGHRSEKDGWRELAEAFDRGHRGGRGMTLAESSAKMMDTFAFQRVYWGGAAIAFEADVTMRQQSGGKLGFDDAMRELRRCCGDAKKRWPAKTLLAKLDAWYGKPIFTEIATRHLARTEFPETDRTMQQIGVVVRGDEVTLDDQHPGAAIRQAIMAPRK